jgi:hypothetical protein
VWKRCINATECLNTTLDKMLGGSQRWFRLSGEERNLFPLMGIEPNSCVVQAILTDQRIRNNCWTFRNQLNTYNMNEKKKKTGMNTF